MCFPGVLLGVTLKRRLSLIGKTLLFGGAVWVLALFLAQPSPGPRVFAAPLLERVQALGELHAVKFTYRDVNDFETTREPAGWLASVPGGTELVHAATRNTATLSFTGTVEAGVDLSKTQITKTPTGVEILLPAPKIYPANVSAKVHDVSRGLFWRDTGIAATAIDEAKNRLESYARQQGILSQARTNVQKQVETLVGDLGVAGATIRFQDQAPTGI